MLSIQNASRRQTRPQSTSGIARLAMILETFLGLGAMAGGAMLILGPDGHLLGMPTKMLSGTPFHDYLIPGIILFTAVGLAPMLVAATTLRHHRIAPLAAIGVGLTLIVWICVEMVMLNGPGSLAWAFYLVLGCAIAGIGIAWRRYSR
jgi:hypothetical protein